MEFAREVNKNVELMVPPHKFGEFHELIEKFNIKSRLIIEDLQK